MVFLVWLNENNSQVLSTVKKIISTLSKDIYLDNSYLFFFLAKTLSPKIKWILYILWSIHFISYEILCSLPGWVEREWPLIRKFARG